MFSQGMYLLIHWNSCFYIAVVPVITCSSEEVQIPFKIYTREVFLRKKKTITNEFITVTEFSTQDKTFLHSAVYLIYISALFLISRVILLKLSSM